MLNVEMLQLCEMGLRNTKDVVLFFVLQWLNGLFTYTPGESKGHRKKKLFGSDQIVYKRC